MRHLLFIFTFLFLLSCTNNISNKDHSIYIDNYNRGDSLLQSYYLGLIEHDNLSDNVLDAIISFRKALIYAEDSVPGLQKLGECNIILREYQEALNYLNRCSYISKNDYTTFLLISRAYRGLGEYDRSIAICDSLISSDTIELTIFIESALLAGNIYALNYDARAIKYYDMILNVSSDNIKSLYGKALFYQNNQMYTEAIDIYYKIKDIDPTNLNTNFNLGFIFMELHDYDIAINFFSDVIVSEKTYYKAYFARGICYEKKGNVIYAEKDFRKALEINPMYSHAKERLDKLLLDNKKYR